MDIGGNPLGQSILFVGGFDLCRMSDGLATVLFFVGMPLAIFLVVRLMKVER